MGAYRLSDLPVAVKKIKTRFRRIKTAIPVPESLEVFERLGRYESNSMHGQLPVLWDRAVDFQVFDRFGNCWIDFTSTIFVTNTGHACPYVKESVQEVLNNNLLHSYTFATEVRANYLEKLIKFTPEQFEKAFLLSSGTEATECALKLMRLYAGKSKKGPGIISFEEAMHGRTLGAQMMGGKPASRSWIGYEDPNIHRLPFPYPWVLDNLGDDKIDGERLFETHLDILKKKGLDFKRDLCGIIMEAYIGWSAALFPVDYARALEKFARANGLLITCDEIQGGFGRTGKLFTYQHYGIEPDLICCGKGIGSGLPLSAVLGRASIMDLPGYGQMSSTHSANPLVCAAGSGTITAIEKLDLVNESKRKGKLLHARLEKMKMRFPGHISYILGKGLLAAVIITDPVSGNPDPDRASRICERAMQKGLLVVFTGRESIKIGPPLTIPDEALVEGLQVLENSLEEITNEEG